MALSDDYQFRDFTLEDYDAAMVLWQTTEGIGMTESDTKPEIAGFLARNPGMSVVVTDSAGRLVGAVLCGHDRRRGTLYHLAVDSAHRKSGLGIKLVETCLARLRNVGVMKCNILVYAHNAAGRAFWSKHAWKAREDLVLMQHLL